MLQHVKNVLSDMLLSLQGNAQRRKLETLSQYWEFVLQETQYKHTKYKLLNAICTRNNGEYATQFVQDRTTLDRYTLKIPKSSMYAEIYKMHSEIVNNAKNPELLEDYEDLLASVSTWLFKEESKYDYSLAKPYSSAYISTL